MAISFKGAHFPPEILLMGVRWYVACPLSYRHVEALMEERGVALDHATVQRWVVKDKQHLDNLRRKGLLPRLKSDRSICLLGHLFCLELCRFC